MAAVSILTISAVIAQGLSGVSAIIVARSGGVHAFGVIVTALGLVAVASDLVDFGTGPFIAREVAARHWTVGAAVRQGVVRGLPVYALSLIASVMLLASGTAVGRLAVTLVAYLCLTLTSSTFISIARAAGDFTVAGSASVISRVSLIAFVTVAAILGLNISNAFILGLAAGSASSLVVALLGLFRAHGSIWAASTPMSTRSLYRTAKALGASNMATDLSSIESPAVALGAGTAASGSYGVATKLLGPLTIPVSAICAVILRKVSIKPDDAENAVRVLRAAMLVLIPYGGVLALIVAFSRPIIEVTVGDSFTASAPGTLRVICCTTLFGIASQLTYTTLVSMKLEQRAALCLWVCLPAGLLLTYLGALSGGPVRAALGGCVAQFVLAMWQLDLFRKRIAELRRGPMESSPRMKARSADPPITVDAGTM